MAGDVANIKVCRPLKLRCGLNEKKPTICHYSYTKPLSNLAKQKSRGLASAFALNCAVITLIGVIHSAKYRHFRSNPTLLVCQFVHQRQTLSLHH